MSTVRWGILGTAKIVSKHMAGAIRASRNGELAAVASRDLERARRFAEEQAIPNAFGSYEELLASPEIDAIYVPLPTGLHAEWCVRCAEAGKPTLCEKPLAAGAQEGRRMVEAFSRAGVILAEGAMYHFHPLTRKVRALVADGAIGKLNAIRTSFFVGLDDKDFRFRKDMGGGGMRDIGYYCVGMMRLLTEEEPESVKAVANWENRAEVDTAVSGVLRFPSGTHGFFSCCIKDCFFDCSYELVGAEGRILVDRGAMVAWPGESFTIKLWRGESREEIAVPEANHYQLMIEDFGDALIAGREPACPAADSLHTLEIIDKAISSALE